MNVFTCQTCGEEFEHKRKDRKYCSIDCYNINRTSNLKSTSILLKGKCRTCEIPVSTKRAYCEDCYKAYLNQPRKRYKMTDRTTCDKCGVEKTLENTFSPEAGIWSTKCRKCCRKVGKTSDTKIKQECVDYKGGCCQVCGYNKSISALDFHHLNPEEKDFTIARKKKSINDEKMRAELDKCALLCSNCHREEHSRLVAGLPSLITNEKPYEFSVWDFILDPENPNVKALLV